MRGHLAAGHQPASQQQHYEARSMPAICRVGAVQQPKLSRRDVTLPTNLVSSCWSSRSSGVQSPAAPATLIADGLAPWLAPLVRPGEGDLHWSLDTASGQLQQQSRGGAHLQHDRVGVPQVAVLSDAGNTGKGDGPSVQQHGSKTDVHCRDQGAFRSRSAAGVRPCVTWQQITARIKSCGNWKELDAVRREYGATFNHIHTSAAITHLAQLNSRHQQQLPMGQQSRQSQGQQQQQQQWCDCPQQDSVQLAPALELVKQQMNKQHQQLQHSLQNHQQHQEQQHQELQLQMHMSSRMLSPGHFASQHDLLQYLLDLALQQLSAFHPRQIANMLWSLSQLQYSCGDSQMAADTAQALLDRAGQLFDVSEGRHLAQIAYAAAKLQLPVKQEWVDSLQQAWLQHVIRCRQQLDQQQDACNSVTEQHSSQQMSRDRNGRQKAAAAEVVSPQAAANFLWAFTHLQQQHLQQQHQPMHSSWLQQLMSALGPDLRLWPARSVAVLVWSCAKLGYRVQQQQQHDVQHTLVEVIRQGISTFSHQDIAQVLWGAAVMGLQLPRPLLQELMARGSEQLQTCQQPDLDLDAAANTSNLSLDSNISFNRNSSLNSSLSISSSSSSLGSNSSLGSSSSSSSYSSNGSGQYDIPAAPCGSAAADTAHSVALVLWSLAKMQVPAGQLLPPRLLKPWLVALMNSCDSGDTQSLAVAAWALCRLQLAGSCPRVLQAMIQAAAQQQVHPAADWEGLPTAGGSSVPSRCIANLVWAAGHCAVSSTATASGGTPVKVAGRQQGAVGRQDKQRQEGLRQLQTLSSLLQLDTMQAPAAVSFLGDGRQTCGKSTKLHEAVQAMLLAAADLLQPSQQSEQRQSTITPAVPGASLRDLSQVMWGVAKLKVPLPAAWWKQSITQLRQLLLEHRRQQHWGHAAQQEFAQSLAVAVWSLGVAKVQLPRSLIRTIQTVSVPLLQSQSCSESLFSPQSHVMLVVGLTYLCRAAASHFGSLQQRHNSLDRRASAKHRRHRSAVLRYSTPVNKQEICSKQLYRPSRKTSSSCRRHSRLWVSVAGLKLQWLVLFCRSAVSQLQYLPPDGLVAVLWAVGRLRFNPGVQFLDAALQRLQVLLPQCTARHLSLFLWSMVRLQHVPGPAAAQCIAEAFEQRTASASKADTQIMCWTQEKLRQLRVRQMLQAQATWVTDL